MCGRRQARARLAGRGTLPGQPHHRRPLGRPLSQARARRDAKPLQPPASPAPPHARHHRGTGGAPAARAPHRPGAAGRPLQRRRLHRPPHPRPAPPAASPPADPALIDCDPAFERARPGELVHIDVKKLGRIPNGGGHKVLGQVPGRANQDRRNGTGYAYLHTALDDHSRLAYTEDLPDEKAGTCARSSPAARAWFAARGVNIERCSPTTPGPTPRTLRRDTCRDLGISPRWTRPWRPQTNGKVERFHRTLLDEWAYTPALHLRHRTTSRVPRLAGLVQLPPTPHRHQRPHTSQPRHQPVRSAQLVRLQDEEQEAQEARLGHDGFGEQLTGGWIRLRLADDRDPETGPVKTSITACSGLCQMLIRAVWPPMVHSSVRWVASK
ncbi:hypothetical protein SPURM210S_06702 [Streptomyces purpurascens]